ncbi:MAG: type I methionyl aminopeptidase [Eggerthellaceae bacterium]|nr:type I methionyl aminopeptidase [Eggerthellaceae bacterium]
MIIKKTPAEIEAMKEAGCLSAMVLREVGALVQPGISTLELDNFAEKFIRSHGGIPTFKGYGGFPGSICASVNDQIVHGIPSADVILQEGDIISIDTGATVNGWVGDNAWTFPVGKVSDKVKRLLETTEECMWAAIDAARVGNHLGDIGYACQSLAERRGFGVVREYVGHGVGRSMHEDPSVPNYGRKHHGIKLESGMVIAIEPMINMGTRKTRQGSDGWLVLTKDGKPSAHFEKTIAITDDGPVLLTVEPYFRRPVNE